MSDTPSLLRFLVITIESPSPLSFLFLKFHWGTNKSQPKNSLRQVETGWDLSSTYWVNLLMDTFNEEVYRCMIDKSIVLNAQFFIDLSVCHHMCSTPSFHLVPHVDLQTTKSFHSNAWQILKGTYTLAQASLAITLLPWLTLSMTVPLSSIKSIKVIKVIASCGVCQWHTPQ